MGYIRKYVRCLFVLVLLSCFSVKAKQFKIFNQADIPVEVSWKSLGFKTQERSGTFIINPDELCFGETYKDNCVNFLIATSLDGKYKAKTPRFCKDSKVIITLESYKKSKKMRIRVQDLQADEMEKSI